MFASDSSKRIKMLATDTDETAFFFYSILLSPVPVDPPSLEFRTAHFVHVYKTVTHIHINQKYVILF